MFHTEIPRRKIRQIKEWSQSRQNRLNPLFRTTVRTIAWLLVSLNSKWPSCLAECDPEQSDQAARQEWCTYCNDRENIIHKPSTVVDREVQESICKNRTDRL